MNLEAHLAVGCHPLNATVGGDNLLEAAPHQLWVIALLLHLCTREGKAKATVQHHFRGLLVGWVRLCALQLRVRAAPTRSFSAR